MNQNYSNLPLNFDNSESTLQAFDVYYSVPVEINSNVYAAMTGYFTNKGFDQSAAESISTIIIRQAKNDGYNPMQILDTIKKLSANEMSGLIAEILNYNRYKTSSLGVAQTFEPIEDIKRNILA